ncbi:MAG: hypothetical protein CMJ46_13535 [Planctomyces sp.]|nr:hypothetical protein [Planctomyces sp.]
MSKSDAEPQVDHVHAQPKPAQPARYHSMDQFRGFIILMMYLVHTHLFHVRVFENTKWHAQFGDMIMPGFIFAVGFSFRLSILRRYPQAGAFRTGASYLRRSVLLILIVMMMEGFGNVASWSEMNELPRSYVDETVAESNDVGMDRGRQFGERFGRNNQENVAEEAEGAEEGPLLPEHFWLHYWHWFLGTIVHHHICEVLAIIAVTQLIILPLILTSVRTRLIAMGLFTIAHLLLTGWFNWDYLNGRPNAFDDFLNFRPRGGYDGGLFGDLNWAVVMLAGSLSYDMLIALQASWKTVGKFIGIGVALMFAGYLLMFPGRLYYLNAESAEGQMNQQEAFLQHPVWPPMSEVGSRSFSEWFPPIPVLQADSDEDIVVNNYWKASKYVVSMPYVIFSVGFCFALYGLFVAMSDVLGLKIGVFRTFGSNALIAYALHFFIWDQIEGMGPRNAPDWFAYVQFGIFFAIMYLIVFSLERRKLFVRL